MKESPIIFSPDMVRALVQGRKTMTRRLVKPNYEVGDLLWVRENWQPVGFPKEDWFLTDYDIYNIHYPATNTEDSFMLSDYSLLGHYCKLLYKELEKRGIEYDAGLDEEEYGYRPCPEFKVRPSIHMFKEFSRIWLKCTSLHSEPLHKITNGDAIAEGVAFNEHFNGRIKRTIFQDYLSHPHTSNNYKCAYDSFKSLWIKINGLDSWEKNPTVWVTKFEVISVNGKKNGRMVQI